MVLRDVVCVCVCAVPPSLDVDQRYLEQQAHMGGMVKINVSVQGDPAPVVTWYKDGRPMRDDRHTMIDTSDFMSTMSIRRAAKDDSGEYEVVAKNEWGTSSLSFSVKVMGESSCWNRTAAYLSPGIIYYLAAAILMNI